jgi:hypothetical protein
VGLEIGIGVLQGGWGDLHIGRQVSSGFWCVGLWRYLRLVPGEAEKLSHLINLYKE